MPLAAGSAWAHRQAGTDAVAVTYFGDGAINIGSVLETMNLAAAWKLPLCFFIENNLYAVSTTVAEATGEPRLSGRGLGFGIPSWQVDGMDPLAVHLAMQEALAHMRAGNGPTVVEADVYRYFHQNGPFPAAPSGTAPRRRRRSGGPATRSAVACRPSLGRHRRPGIRRPPPTGKAPMAEPATSSSSRSGRQAGAAADQAGAWPDPTFADVGVRGDLSELDGCAP